MTKKKIRLLMFPWSMSLVAELYIGRLLDIIIFTITIYHFLKDVAEFERKELIKVRIHHALRTVSTALTVWDSRTGRLFRVTCPCIPYNSFDDCGCINEYNWYWAALSCTWKNDSSPKTSELWNCLSLHLESTCCQTKLFIANAEAFSRIVFKQSNSYKSYQVYTVSYVSN